jgi:hypothetical protein
MANITSISNKIARNAQILGLTVSAQGYDSFGNAYVTLTADTGSLSVYYLTAEIQYPMGGVNPMVSPYLGIGVANPGQLMLVASVFYGWLNGRHHQRTNLCSDSRRCAHGLTMTLVLANSDVLSGRSGTDSSINGLPASVGGAGEPYWVRLRGDSDLLGMGQ